MYDGVGGSVKIRIRIIARIVNDSDMCRCTIRINIDNNFDYAISRIGPAYRHIPASLGLFFCYCTHIITWLGCAGAQGKTESR